MTNSEFLNTIKHSFFSYLGVRTSRSTAKLKSLHGDIASDIANNLGCGYSIKSQGFGNSKEGKLIGRYYPKNVDITICKGNESIAGYSIKFVVRNYSQNSNNYFENMLGETANIKSANIPYFQIIIMLDKIPYFKKEGKFKRWDIVTEHNLEKYITMSKDDPEKYFHTPNKTLIVLLHLKDRPCGVFVDENNYAEYYLNLRNINDLIKYSDKFRKNFENRNRTNTIYNNYETFLAKTCHLIKSI